MLYYKLPFALFTNDKYSSVCNDGKVLYATLLHRRGLSEKNNYMDDYGVYIFMSREEMSEITNASQTSVKKYMKQLTEAGLVSEHRQGQGKPNKIYVFLPADQTDQLKIESRVTEFDIQDSSNSEKENNDHLEDKNIAHNNYKENDKKELNKSISISMAEEMLKEHFEYDQHFAGTLNEDMADVMIKVMADVFASQSGSVRIHKVETDIDIVKSRLLKLGPAHLDYTIGQIVKSKNKIKGSGAAYMLTCLYDAYANYNLYFSKSYCSNYA